MSSSISTSQALSGLFTNNFSTRLRALTSTALAMPGLAVSGLALPGLAAAAIPPESPVLGVRYAIYGENASPASQTLGGQSIDRYDIDVLHVNAILPYSEKVSFAVDVDFETLSGASPWFVALDEATNTAKVFMTGASIDDERLDVQAAGSYYLPDARLDAHAGISTEDDYQSFYGGMGTALEFYQQQLVVDMAMSFAADRLEPTPFDRALPGTTVGGPNPIRTTDERKGSYGVYIGFTQVINRLMTFQSGVNLLLKTGYLSDPYKLVQIYDNEGDLIIRNDNRPSDRSSGVWVNRVRAYVEPWGGALHVDYRYYSDNWSVRSHTLDVSWHQDLPGGWTVAPGVRAYQQTEASFYDAYYAAPRSDGFYSSDYRLSDYSASSYYIEGRKKWDKVDAVLAVENYTSKGDSPALTDFMLMTLGFDYRF